MRADRLVAILLMLQRRGQVTALEVAAELEISERTARRDLDALAMAGVPVYSQAGRGGGWRLAGGGRIDLSGLSAQETRALFLVAGPDAMVTPEVRSALRKLIRALPEPLRTGAEAAADAVVVDPDGWGSRGAAPSRPPLLSLVEAAVVDGECLRMTYRGRVGTASARVVHPLGLAVKDRDWYLLAGTDLGLRTFRVDRIADAELLGEPVVRPAGFDLPGEWARVVERVDRLRTPIVASATAKAEALPYLRMVFGSRLTVLDGTAVGAADHIGSGAGAAIELRGGSVRALAAEVAGFGSWVIVQEPAELAAALADIGGALVGLYAARQAEAFVDAGRPPPNRVNHPLG